MADFSIQPLTAALNAAQTGSENARAVPSEASSFGSVLDHSIQTVNRMQQAADEHAAQLTSGESKDIHGTMIAMQKAEISMSLLMEVRNKVISAYDEIKRMQF